MTNKKIQRLKSLLERKLHVAENRVEAMHWHNVAGPTLMIEVKQVGLIKELLEIINGPTEIVFTFDGIHYCVRCGNCRVRESNDYCPPCLGFGVNHI